jgi:hypothetical protein
MTPSIEVVVSLLTAVGIGGILGAFFRSRFEQQKQVREKERELKRKRYGAILILMLTKLDPKDGLPKTRNIRLDLKNLEDVEKELEMELLHGVLFASDDVIKAMAEFTRRPTHAAYIKSVTAMRKDLWSKKTSVDAGILDLLTKNE